MSESLLTYLTQVASFLKVPAGKIVFNCDLVPTRAQKNTVTNGFLNIIFTLLKESNIKLSEMDAREELEIRQWLEYYIVYVLHCQSQQNANQILHELNAVLSTRTYIVSQHLSIADVVLYYFLQNLMSNLPYLDKEKYINVSRWFDNIQQNASIRQSHKMVPFNTNYLVSATTCQH